MNLAIDSSYRTDPQLTRDGWNHIRLHLEWIIQDDGTKYMFINKKSIDMIRGYLPDVSIVIFNKIEEYFEFDVEKQGFSVLQNKPFTDNELNLFNDFL